EFGNSTFLPNDRPKPVADCCRGAFPEAPAAWKAHRHWCTGPDRFRCQANGQEISSPPPGNLPPPVCYKSRRGTPKHLLCELPPPQALSRSNRQVPSLGFQLPVNSKFGKPE